MSIKSYLPAQEDLMVYKLKYKPDLAINSQQ